MYDASDKLSLHLSVTVVRGLECFATTVITQTRLIGFLTRDRHINAAKISLGPLSTYHSPWIIYQMKRQHRDSGPHPHPSSTFALITIIQPHFTSTYLSVNLKIEHQIISDSSIQYSSGSGRASTMSNYASSQDVPTGMSEIY